MNQWEQIIGKLEAAEPLSPDEIEYVKKVFDAAETFIEIALKGPAGD